MSEDEKYVCEKCKRQVGSHSIVEVEGGLECEECGNIIDFGELKILCDGECFNKFIREHEEEIHRSIDLV